MPREGKDRVVREGVKGQGSRRRETELLKSGFCETKATIAAAPSWFRLGWPAGVAEMTGPSHGKKYFG